MTSDITAPAAKPHHCNHCKSAFATLRALKDHCRSTNHVFLCTKPRCKKTCFSSAALAAHLSSTVHTTPITTGTENVAAPSIKLASPSKVNGPSFVCTAPGCRKVFKTSRARAQHLGSSIHQRKVPLITVQNTVVAATPGGQRPADDTAKDAQPVVPGRTETTSGNKAGVRNSKAVGPKVQSSQSVAPHSKALSAPEPTQPTPRKNIETSARVSLFRWDTRWSMIPTAKHASTMTALKALVPRPEVSSLIRVDKVFWTPDHKSSPAHDPTVPKRQVIVLDCEMVGTGLKGTTSELARLSAVDFLTGELIIDTLVEPICKVTDWRTQWSGITARSMAEAVVLGHALKGSTIARANLFDYMDSRTILVGHALHYDLEALGIRHGLIVDSSILAKTAVGTGVKREWGLKMLCKELLGITVQDNGKHGHDSVEDTLAAREVVLWCLWHKKALKTWGSKKKKEFYANKREGTSRQNIRGRITRPQTMYEDDSDEFEFRNVSLQEFNEMCGYPEWYDNWSD